MEKKNKTLGSIFLSNFTNKDNKVEKETQNKPQLIEPKQETNPAITQFKQSLLSGIANRKLGGNQQNGQQI